MFIGADGVNELRVRRGRKPDDIIGRAVAQLQPDQPDDVYDTCWGLGTLDGLLRGRLDPAHLSWIDDTHEQHLRGSELDHEWNVYVLHSRPWGQSQQCSRRVDSVLCLLRRSRIGCGVDQQLWNPGGVLLLPTLRNDDHE